MAKFWKLSQGSQFFTESEVLTSINDRLVYVHRDTKAKGSSTHTQAYDFITADIGDYFYLTHGNEGIYLFGQFSGPVNYFSKKVDFSDPGWLDRPYRLILKSFSHKPYSGPEKWWTPNHTSTFVQIPPAEFGLFEEYILSPYFGITSRFYGFHL